MAATKARSIRASRFIHLFRSEARDRMHHQNLRFSKKFVVARLKTTYTSKRVVVSLPRQYCNMQNKRLKGQPRATRGSVLATFKKIYLSFRSYRFNIVKRKDRNDDSIWKRIRSQILAPVASRKRKPSTTAQPRRPFGRTAQPTHRPFDGTAVVPAIRVRQSTASCLSVFCSSVPLFGVCASRCCVAGKDT